MLPHLHLLRPPEDKHTPSQLLVDGVQLPGTPTNLRLDLSGQREADGQRELLLVVLDHGGQQLEQRGQAVRAGGVAARSGVAAYLAHAGVSQQRPEGGVVLRVAPQVGAHVVQLPPPVTCRQKHSGVSVM